MRFFRMAERKIVEHTGRGVICYISNYSWLDGLSHTGMRERYLEAFDRIWIDNLNGDKYRTGKLTPEGEADPSVFSTAQNREDIQVGTAIALLLKTPSPRGRGAGGEGNAGSEGERLRFRSLWGRTKHQQLLADSGKEPVTLQATYAALDPAAALGFPFAPSRTSAAYLSWPLLPDLFPVSFPGVTTSRDPALVDFDRDILMSRITKYFNPIVSDQEIRRVVPSLMTSTKRFNSEKTRTVPAEDLFHHAIAVLHSGAYRDENAGALRQDWPRVPLPGEPRQLSLSTALGRRVASLLDPEAAVPGVTTGNVVEPLRSIAVVKRVDGKPIDPGAGHLAVTAGWGHGGKNGVTMPGKGKVEVRTGSSRPGPLPAGEGDTVVLGGRIYDIHLNNETYWHNIPEAVWEYTIGGYQVIKKWLSYRERDLLGRDLTLDEVRYVTEMARRIAAILMLAGDLDANYRAGAGGAQVWPKTARGSVTA